MALAAAAAPSRGALSVSTPSCARIIRTTHVTWARLPAGARRDVVRAQRAHVHGTISSYERPVTYVTRRVGRPYTLVLTKTRELFTHDAAERATWAGDLAWLRGSAKTFTSHKRAKPRRPLDDDHGSAALLTAEHANSRAVAWSRPRRARGSR
jgi:hypothetical protein